MKCRDAIHPGAQKAVQKYLDGYTIACGCQVRSGRRQSIPSSSIDNCARVSAAIVADRVGIALKGQLGITVAKQSLYCLRIGLDPDEDDARL